jgi:hypothetical protein
MVTAPSMPVRNQRDISLGGCRVNLARMPFFDDAPFRWRMELSSVAGDTPPVCAEIIVAKLTICDERLAAEAGVPDLSCLADIHPS